jgi:hypothetical protein
MEILLTKNYRIAFFPDNGQWGALAHILKNQTYDRLAKMRREEMYNMDRQTGVGSFWQGYSSLSSSTRTARKKYQKIKFHYFTLLASFYLINRLRICNSKCTASKNIFLPVLLVAVKNF